MSADIISRFMRVYRVVMARRVKKCSVSIFESFIGVRVCGGVIKWCIFINLVQKYEFI